MPEKKKMGRPIIGLPKNIRTQIRFDEETLLKLDELRDKKKMSRSEYIRWLIMNQN
ncbi:CopG family transcriptional regulator [uncultured Dubosiella sp.]|uniref:ribbon-helix-helix domain-containing protein n=1 Tax=uncultured Dubosiella sp. TaxID=1937011 RepID=UPI0025880237|nr:CopG family transcriptional regulator [uncultured Dubosiella sp.]